MPSEIIKKLEKISEKLEQVDIIVQEQEGEINELKQALRKVYEENLKKKIKLEKYEKKCGNHLSEENTSRDNE